VAESPLFLNNLLMAGPMITTLPVRFRRCLGGLSPRSSPGEAGIWHLCLRVRCWSA